MRCYSGSQYINAFKSQQLVAGLLAEVQLDRQSLPGGCSSRRFHSRQRGTLTPVFCDKTMTLVIADSVL